MNLKIHCIKTKAILTLAVLTSWPVALTHAADIRWIGSTDSYTNASAWSGGVVPGTNDNAINDSGTNNVVQINSGNPDWAVNQILAGDATGDGAFVQNSQAVSLNPTARAFRLGVSAGSTGVYTLNGGSINYTNGGFNIGELGTGILAMNGGSITGIGNMAVNIGTGIVPNALTASVDGGTNKAGFTWFEQGLYTANTALGLPAAGSTFVSTAQPDHSYTMAASYTNNNAILVDATSTSATITLTTPTAYSALSFAGSSGNGAMTLNYTVNHADSTIETGSVTFPDWFAANAPALGTGGRVSTDGTVFQIQGAGGTPKVLSQDIALTNTTSAVTSINLTYTTGAGEACVLALSGSTGGTFDPISFTGYNQDMIMEAGAVTFVDGSVTDVLNQAGGTIALTGAGQFFVGNYGVGIYNLSGGTNNVNNYIAFGRSGGNGTVNMTGGLLNQTGSGNNLLVGTGYQAPVGGSAVGVLNQSGGLISCQGQFLCPENAPSTGTYNLSSNGVLLVNNWIAIGRGGAVGVLNISGGSITKTGNAANHIVLGAGGAGTVNQTGGAITNLTSDTWIGENSVGTWNLNGGTANLSAVHIGQLGSSTGTLNVNGGSLSTAELTSGSPVAFSTLNLNGGVIAASASSVNFLHDIFLAQVQSGGAIFDSQGFDITIPQALPSNGGDGSGGLAKLGAGTLTLSGLNTYVGPTIVGGGKLIVTTDSTGGGDVLVYNGADLSLKVQSLNAQFNAANAGFSNSVTSLDIDLGSFGNPTAAAFNILGNLNVNGTVTLNVADSVPSPGQIPLIKYSTKTGSGSFVLGTLPSGSVGYLSNNVLNASIDLVVTSAGAPRWDGTVAGGVWDINNTANWFDLGTSVTSTYHDGTPVLFNDAAAGTTNVNLVTTVTPGALTFNDSALGYVITGTGKISGAAGLSKSGAATVSLLNTGGNNFTGPVVLSGGTLTVTNLANGGSPSAIGASSANQTNLVFAGGALSYAGSPVNINRGYSIQTGGGTIENVGNLTLSGLVTAASGAAFAKSGSAQLAYTAAGTNTLTGTGADYLVKAGTVLFDGSSGGQTNLIQGRMNMGAVPGVNTAMTLTNTTLTISGLSEIGNSNNATATLTLNKNAILNSLGNPMSVADGGGSPSSGAIVQNDGTINLTGELWVGQNTSGVGTYTLSGGTMNSHNWLAVGRFDGIGTLNMTGGTINKDGSAMVIGTGAGNNSKHSVGVFNFSGGTLTSSSEFWVGENAGTEATNNISGTAVFNLNNWMSIGRGGHGVVNFSGGTINHNGGTAFIVGDGGTGFFNQTGGALTTQRELWVGQGGPTSRYDLSAGSVLVNNWVAIGRGANGVFNMSGGSLTKTGNGGNNFLIGAGHDGVLNQTGGAITNLLSETRVADGPTGTWNISGGTANLSVLHISQNSGNVGILNLNGGSITATEVTMGNAAGKGTLNFNGGTLIAGSAANPNFLHGVTNYILAGGATISSGTNLISVSQPMLDGGGNGGLTKIGNGTLYLNATNTYTGATIVSNGTLGGTGILLSPVSVAATATLSPGVAGIGTLTVSNTVTLAANSSTLMEVNKTAGTRDLLRGVTQLNYGGTLIVSNLSGSYAPGDSFKLFDAGTYAGSFNAIVPAAPAAGLVWNTSQLAVNGTLLIASGVNTASTNITFSVTGNTLNLSWPADHTGWTLQAQTNSLATGLNTNWVAWPNSTTTNAVSIQFNSANPTVFFRLVYP